MRYLGKLYKAAEGVTYVQEVCLREMVARACKHILRRGLKLTGPSYLAEAVSVARHFVLPLLLSKMPASRRWQSCSKARCAGASSESVIRSLQWLSVWCFHQFVFTPLFFEGSLFL